MYKSEPTSYIFDWTGIPGIVKRKDTDLHLPVPVPVPVQVQAGQPGQPGQPGQQNQNMADSFYDDVDCCDEDEELDAATDAFRSLERQKRKILSDRTNPFVALSDEEFVERFRLRKHSISDLFQEIRQFLPAANDSRGCPVPPQIQLLIGIQCMSTGEHQGTIAKLYEISQTTVSKSFKTVTRAIASRSQYYINPPCGTDLHNTIQQFYQMAGMPGVLGTIGCTHIEILKPSMDKTDVFQCRKGFYSLNIQGVAGPDLRFHNVVARWPGTATNNKIFEKSKLCEEFEKNSDPRFHLLGDNGYLLKTYLLTPVLFPSNSQEEGYNMSHARTRNVIDLAFGVLKRRFKYLGQKVRTELETAKTVIVACVVLHNIGVMTKVVSYEDGEVGDIRQHVPSEVPVQDNVNINGMLKQQQIIRDYF